MDKLTLYLVDGTEIDQALAFKYAQRLIDNDVTTPTLLIEAIQSDANFLDSFIFDEANKERLKYKCKDENLNCAKTSQQLMQGLYILFQSTNNNLKSSNQEIEALKNQLLTVVETVHRFEKSLHSVIEENIQLKNRLLSAEEKTQSLSNKIIEDNIQWRSLKRILNINV